jgi:hypothetical protein
LLLKNDVTLFLNYSIIIGFRSFHTFFIILAHIDCLLYTLHILGNCGDYFCDKTNTLRHRNRREHSQQLVTRCMAYIHTLVPNIVQIGFMFLFVYMAHRVIVITSMFLHFSLPHISYLNKALFWLQYLHRTFTQD